MLEVLDARDPMGCRCEHIEQMIMASGTEKHVVLVLNKIGVCVCVCVCLCVGVFGLCALPPVYSHRLAPSSTFFFMATSYVVWDLVSVSLWLGIGGRVSCL